MSLMLQEALDAPNRLQEFLSKDEAVFQDLAKRLRTLDPAFVATVARGSSDHAATYAEYLFPLCTGKLVASIPPSLLTVLKAKLQLKNQFVLALSQGGGSPDIVGSLENARKAGALTAAIVNEVNSPLAKSTEVLLPQHAGQEKSITATKSVICTLAAIARLAATWSEDQALLTALKNLPGVLSQAARTGGEIDESLLKGVSHAYVLSRALGLSAARELALKFKETCGIHAEPFSAAEVRHGPREVVDKNFLVVALMLPGSGGEDVKSVAEELKTQGARVLLVGPKKSRADFVIPEAGDYRLDTLVALQFLYPWIARSAVALGRNPDRPRTLQSKVIETT